jgi:nicotinamidase-related amidase
MSLAEKSTSFLNYLEQFVAERPTLSLADVISQPERTAILSIDVINAFLYDGPLASPRVAPIGEPIAQLMAGAWAQGVRDILLIQEGHHQDSLEFEAYGEHAIKGTPQAEAIDLIKSLPFYDQLLTIYKDSIHPAINTEFE